MELLDKCTDQQLYQLVHQVIDEICTAQPPDTSAFVPEVWPDVDHLQKACQLCRQLVVLGCDARGKKHPILLSLPEHAQKVVNQCIEVRRIEIRNAIINQTIASNNAVLRDFFWKLKVVLASDKMVNLNQPLLELELKSCKVADDHTSEQVICLELSRNELDNLLSVLEVAQQTLKQKYSQ